MSLLPCPFELSPSAGLLTDPSNDAAECELVSSPLAVSNCLVFSPAIGAEARDHPPVRWELLELEMDLVASVLLMVCADRDLWGSECWDRRTSRCVRSEVGPDAPLGPIPSRGVSAPSSV